MNNIEPIQAEGIKIVSLEAENRPYHAGRRKSGIEKTRVFVSIKDETVMQNLESRMAQRQGAPPRLSPRDMRKHILERVVKELQEKHPEMGIKSPSQLRWSAKAGCAMCPCSPGFVVENSYNWRVDVVVTPAMAEPAS